MARRPIARLGVLATLLVALLALWSPVHRAAHAHVGAARPCCADADDEDLDAQQSHDAECPLCELVPLPPTPAGGTPMLVRGVAPDGALRVPASPCGVRRTPAAGRGPPERSDSPRA